MAMSSKNGLLSQADFTADTNKTGLE